MAGRPWRGLPRGRRRDKAEAERGIAGKVRQLVPVAGTEPQRQDTRAAGSQVGSAAAGKPVVAGSPAVAGKLAVGGMAAAVDRPVVVADSSEWLRHCLVSEKYQVN